VSVFEVQRTGNSSPVSWNGHPIHWSINHHRFSRWQRRIIRQVIADVCPRVGSGNTNDRRTTKKPLNGKAVFDLPGDTGLVVYALWGFEHNPLALGFSDQHWVGDQYLGAIVVLNAKFFDHPVWGTPDAFRTIMAHEMGHAVGLEHPTDANQVMSAALTGLPWKFGDLQGFGVLREAH
jgi:hypothetical protein